MSLKLISALLGAVLLGQLNAAVFASEGGLTLPSQINEPVELDLTNIKINDGHAEYSELLQVYVGMPDNCCTDRTPIAGQYKEHAGILTFVPTYEFIEGQSYVARVKQVGTKTNAVHSFTKFSIKPMAPPLPTQVTNIYPSGTSMPENVLRFYIHFSKPMKPHVAFDYIKLIDASGAVDNDAFMRFKQELWSEDRKRLTLLMDPGRIKRNVSTNLRLGPALRKDKHYTLLVESGWPAANGEQALTRFTKSFLVTDALRVLPNVKQWAITPPALGTDLGLKIKFDRPYDKQLLGTDIKVVSESGLVIPGELFIEDNETALRFQPNNNWIDEIIHIVVDSELEDVAGNNFRDLLDHTIETETKQIRESSIVVKLR